MSPDDQPELDPALADAVRRAYVRPLDEATTQRHVNAILAAAAAGPETRARPAPPRRRRGWLPSLAAGVAALLLLPVGLAAAGIQLPQAVDEPYQAVGIGLPHQGSTPPGRATTAPPVTPRAPTTTHGAPAAPARPRHRRVHARHPSTGATDGAPLNPAPRPGASLGATGRPLPIPPPGATAPAPAKLRPLAVPHTPARPRGLQGAGAKSPRAHPVPARSGSHPAHPTPAKGASGPTPGPKTRAR